MSIENAVYSQTLLKKCEQVINSCITKEQIETARNYCELAMTKVKSFDDFDYYGYKFKKLLDNK